MSLAVTVGAGGETMTPADLIEIESTLAQYRATLRAVGHTANMQAETD